MGSAVVGHNGVFTYIGSTATEMGALGTLVFLPQSTVVSSDGGGANINRQFFTDAQRLYPRGILLRQFPVT